MGKLLQWGITSPQNGAVVGRTITVSGFARVDNVQSPGLIGIIIEDVQVEFGSGGPLVTAQRSGNSWSSTASLSAAQRLREEVGAGVSIPPDLAVLESVAAAVAVGRGHLVGGGVAEFAAL